MKDKNKYFIQDGMISRFDFMDNQEFLPLPTVCALLNGNEEKHDKLAEKFVIVSKALDLACEDLLDNDVSMCEYCEKTGNCVDECPTDQNSEMCVLLNYFAKKSKGDNKRRRIMAKKPTTKDCIKFVCDGLDTINDTMINKNKDLAEQNKIARERLDWEMETKDRVDIPLKKYEGMKQHIDHLTRKNYHYEEIFERLRINEIIDKIDPTTIVVSTMKDQMRLSTRVNIQFECKCLIEQDLNGGKEMTPFERFLKRN